MDYSGGSYFSSWSNSASESYNFVDGSVESYAEGGMTPSGNFMRAGSDRNLKFSEHEKDPTMLTNGCLPYNNLTDLLSGEIVSKDKLPHSLLELEQLQNNGNLQSNLTTQGILQSSGGARNFSKGGQAVGTPLDTPSSTEAHPACVTNAPTDAWRSTPTCGARWDSGGREEDNVLLRAATPIHEAGSQSVRTEDFSNLTVGTSGDIQRWRRRYWGKYIRVLTN